MTKHVKFIFITIIISFLLSACHYSSSVVSSELEKILNSNNYTSEWVDEVNQLNEGEVIETESHIYSIVFHHPYKFRGVSAYDTNEKGIVSATVYQMERNGIFEEKTVYELEGGNTDEFDNVGQPRSEEWFLTQIKSCLVSDELIEEQVINRVNVKKYRISVTAYPFIIFFGFSHDKSDLGTRIFLDEWETCEGYVYIDTNTGYIQKIEFDLSEKKAFNQKVNERILKETNDPLSQIYDFEKLKLAIMISNVNDESNETLQIEKEIDDIMR